ncbi:MAG TPA: DUF4249 domain-containing protein [Bacteroidales bacterium]|nr:DUF4249 domain-containing protein [Bacteroidales bacterium]
MLRNKTFVLTGIIILFAAGCIEPYVPRINVEPGDHFVVSGEVTDQEGYQNINISMASPLNDPGYIPVNGCQVEILDDKDHLFECYEYGSGKYRVWMDADFLSSGTAYKVRIITPDGEEIVSSYDRMPESPGVDSVFYEREEMPTNVPGENIPGLQFYLNLNAGENDSRYYRWTAEETWEYHAPYPLEYYYEGSIKQVSPPDYSNMVCWATNKISRIFTLSTNNLITNSYAKLPLHFVDKTTTKLYTGYCLTLRQYAMSEAAYDFWEKLRINSEERGGLYEHQPLPVEGNLENTTFPDHKVLGYFGASSFSMKRIFIEGIRDMGIYYDSICAPYALGKGGWKEFPPEQWPVFLIYIRYGNFRFLRIIDQGCVDCRVNGGVTVKPDFWKW